jgi:hypothetical protein
MLQQKLHDLLNDLGCWWSTLNKQMSKENASLFAHENVRLCAHGHRQITLEENYPVSKKNVKLCVDGQPQSHMCALLYPLNTY